VQIVFFENLIMLCFYLFYIC